MGAGSEALNIFSRMTDGIIKRYIVVMDTVIQNKSEFIQIAWQLFWPAAATFFDPGIKAFHGKKYLFLKIVSFK